MESTRLNFQQKQKAIDVLVAAFFNYPMFDLYFPDPERRKQILPWYLGKVLNCALHYGEVYTNPEITGVIFTLPPGHTRISQWEYILSGFGPAPFVLGLPDYIRSQACENFVALQHEKHMQGIPHFYLWGLVVDPIHKKQGIGTALLQLVAKKADIEKLPIYLETHDVRNVDYYRRMDFQLVGSSAIPKSEVPIWCMVREPK